MQGKLMLYRDQWGNCWHAHSRKELSEKIGKKHIAKMYIDSAGKQYHVGYVVGRH